MEARGINNGCIMTRYIPQGADVAISRLKEIQTHIARLEGHGNVRRQESVCDDQRDKGLTVAEAFELGSLYLELGDGGRAEQAFKHSILCDPAHRGAWINLGKIQLEFGRYEDAEMSFERAIGDNRSDIEGIRLRSLAQWSGRKTELAEKGLREGLFQRSLENSRSLRDGDNSVFDDQKVSEANRMLHDFKEIAGWHLVVENSAPAQDFERLQRVADGRPIYISAMHGRGWVLSHMILQIEMVMRRLRSESESSPFVIMINPNEYCNDALRSMYGRELWLIDARYPRLRRRLIAVREWLKEKNRPEAVDVDPANPVPHMRTNWAPHEKLFMDEPPVVTMTDAEEESGKRLLDTLGIPEGAEFIVFGIRERNYYRAAWETRQEYSEYWKCALPLEALLEIDGEMAPGGLKAEAKMKFVSNEIQDVLQTPLQNYLKMAESMAASGLHVVRMGMNVDQPLPDHCNPNLIDYASRGRSDFGDVYLSAKCKFLLAGATGITPLAHMFNVPTVVTDFYVPSIGRFNSGNMIPSLVIPRKFWYAEERRFLTFSEMFDCARHYCWAENCSRDGIEQIPNSPEEIADVAAEMNARIDGVWESTDEDDYLQKRVKALFQPRHEGYGLAGRFGARFLHDYVDLIA